MVFYCRVLGMDELIQRYNCYIREYHCCTDKFNYEVYGYFCSSKNLPKKLHDTSPANLLFNIEQLKNCLDDRLNLYSMTCYWENTKWNRSNKYTPPPLYFHCDFIPIEKIIQLIYNHYKLLDNVHLEMIYLQEYRNIQNYILPTHRSDNDIREYSSHPSSRKNFWSPKNIELIVFFNVFLQELRTQLKL